MELKDIVCDYHYVLTLQILGLKKPSLFYLSQCGEVGTNARVMRRPFHNTYTVAELTEMIPKGIKSGNTYYLEVDYCVEDKYWHVRYWNGQHNLCTYDFYDSKLANALASAMWELIENKHVKVEDLNNATNT